MRRPLGLIVPVLVLCAALPVASLIAFGDRMVMPPMWAHFYGVGVSALVATVAAAALTIVGAKSGDVRTVVVGRRLLAHGGTPRRSRADDPRGSDRQQRP